MLLQETRLPGNQQDDTSFHLSLVMAGAVSAGAYTAGVMDFLIEALDAMEAARDAGDPNMPANHRVSIDAVLGASAGGICSALLPSIVRGSGDPYTNRVPNILSCTRPGLRKSI